MNEYFKIGKLVSAFALGGEIILEHSLGKKTSLRGVEAIFLEEGKDSFLPYFLTGAKIKSESEIYLKLEGVDSREAARKLVGKEVWIPEAAFKKFAAKSAPISLLGFHIINEGQDIGEILEVIEQPHQILCKIMIHEKEALIPLHDDTLLKLDNKNRKIFVSLPDGLLDLYR